MTVAIVEATEFGLSHLVQACRERDQEALLLTSDRSRYRFELSRIPANCLRIVDVDTTDPDALLQVLEPDPHLSGIVRSTDQWSLPALEVARWLGLPHQSPSAIKMLRDKGRLRRHLHEAGLSRTSSIDFDPNTTLAETLGARLTFPCIIKDSMGGSSRNVWLVRDSEHLSSVLAAARRSTDLRSTTLTAEPFLSGPLYSAETITWNGDTTVLGISSRGLSPEPHFREENASFPVHFPLSELKRTTQWIAAMLSATGFGSGLTHTEFILTAHGPELVEINARLGGGLIGENIYRALDVNIHGALVDLAMGQRPRILDLDLTPNRGAAQVAVYAPRKGVFAGISGVQSLAGHLGDPMVYEVRSIGAVVPEVNDQRGVVAMLLATGATAELALHNALSAAGKLSVHMRSES